ncbi:MarR family transcriptional regulator [Amycolatopsis rhabdoformis]|uniref:MarR family transcriptional regulator n=1 Tax=Amycolatopsis rhabdoformis TaxID=1448059 RepID=A0ABZ1IJP4_9PSEU|nr:MarR family transcriptional regulator [Amycolatopsis rhabdoformis]WSE34695.1 MarR family transcriptional regulator [Amycolatopsis rhabdoformis]
MAGDSGADGARTKSVDDILTQWAESYREVDAAPMGIIGRVWRLSRYFEQGVQRRLDDFGCTLPEFDVLATLRRSGSPYSLTAGELMHSAMVTSGAVTNRVDRLVERGWVTRVADPNNRRVRCITLTPEGLDLVNRIVPAHLENERQMLSTLSGSEQDTLETLLKKLAADHEQPNRKK